MTPSRKVIQIKTPTAVIQTQKVDDPIRPGINIFINDELAAVIEFDRGCHYIRTYKLGEEEVQESHAFEI